MTARLVGRVIGGGVGVILLAAPGRAQAVMTVRADNALQIARPSETIGISWPSVRAQLPSVQPAAVRVLDAVGNEVPSQVVDNDGDGQPDELIFQADFAPRENKRFTVEPRAPQTKPKPKVYATHTDPRDDVAWESDRIAFRIYGQGLWKVDSLNSSGLDIWVKRTRDLIVDKWYAKGHDSYHQDTGEGADFFDVGETLGAGGTAIWRNDKLYRALNFKSWRVIANGPVRAIFELQYQPWDAGGMRVTETKRIAIDAGQNLNHIVSTFRAGGGATDIPWATGIVKRASVVGSESKARPWAWLCEWGPLLPKGGGHGDMGIGILLPRDIVTDWKETNDHYLAIARATSGEPVSYWVGAGWTASHDFRDVQDWWTYLDDWSQRLSSPIKTTSSH
jgi:pectinesterase